jgi:hypothetical protein
VKYRTGFGHRIADWLNDRREPRGRPMKRYNDGADEPFSAFLEKQQRRVRAILADKDTTRTESWYLTTKRNSEERRVLEGPPLSVGDSEKAPRW